MSGKKKFIFVLRFMQITFNLIKIRGSCSSCTAKCEHYTLTEN